MVLIDLYWSFINFNVMNNIDHKQYGITFLFLLDYINDLNVKNYPQLVVQLIFVIFDYYIKY